MSACTLDEINDALKGHYDPVKNIIYELYLFNSRCQKSGESINDYVHALKALASNCEFGTFLNDMLRDRLVVGLKNQKIQRALLGMSKLTFDNAVREANTMEVATKEVSAIQSGQNSTVNDVREKHKSSTGSVSNNSNHKNNNSKFVRNKGASSSKIPDNYSCFSCGGNNHLRQNCKYKDVKCHKCSKVGHLKKMCKNKSTSTTNVIKSSDNKVSAEYIFSNCSDDCSKPPLVVNLVTNDVEVPMELDTGTARIIMPKVSFDKYFPDLS